MTVRGRIERRDIGMGVILLHADDGRSFLLVGDAPALQPGSTVEVDGELLDDAPNLGMTGQPVLRVQAARPVGD